MTEQDEKERALLKRFEDALAGEYDNPEDVKLLRNLAFEGIQLLRLRHPDV